MGHTSKWQIWVQWSHFSRLFVTVDFDGLSTKLIIIFIIRVWYMGHTSKWQIWVQWSHFSRLLVTVDFDGLSTKLIIIFIIELVILDVF